MGRSPREAFPESVAGPTPETRAVGGLVDEGWDISFWGNSYPDSVNYWKLQVDKDLPVHGNIHTYQEVLALIRMIPATSS